MYLVINSGSSSLKYKLFDDALQERAGGLIERIGFGGPADHAAALEQALVEIAKGGFRVDDIRAFGHRVVHGGEEFVEPTLITTANLKKLRAYSKLAPLHNPANLAGIDACRVLAPKAANVAVFDTAFYRTIPPAAYMYALPWEYYAKHKIRKYGFHGISHEYVTKEAARLLKKPYTKLKIVSCHLGSGASVTAVNGGKAVDTSMGFTPLEGLTMSTRCGDIDPAIPLYLIRELGMDAQEVDDLMNKKSGFLGLTGHKDLRDVLAAAAKGDKRAKVAVDMFCYDVARYVGQFAAVMKGVDAVVFTAGIGEHSALIRKAIMKLVKLPGTPKVMVVPTNEELMIAKETKHAV